MAIVPALRMPGLVLAVVFAGLAAMGWRNLKRAELNARQPVTVPPMSDGEQMFEVLAMLEIPIDTGTSDPLTALRSGAAKAAVYHGYTQLMSGRTTEAMSTLQGVASANNGRVSAAAHYLLGKHHEGEGRDAQALDAYRSALSAAPDYGLASAALRKSDNA